MARWGSRFDSSDLLTRLSTGGGGGIRTHETLLRSNGFQDRRFQPLTHPSAVELRLYCRRHMFSSTLRSVENRQMEVARTIEWTWVQDPQEISMTSGQIEKKAAH